VRRPRATLRQLAVFETVARHLSFTRAAEELHLTQPTVSVQMRELTSAAGLPLFEQIGKKVSLTAAGLELRRTVVDVFEAWARFESAVADLQGLKRGRLALAAVTTASYFVPRLLGPFSRRYPQVDIALEIANRDAVIERLAANRDDLYIMGAPPEHLDIEKIAVLDNPLVVLAARDHPLARARRIPLAQLAGERFVAREPGSGTRMAADRHFRAHGIERVIRMALGSNEAVKQAVAGGLGISVLSLHTLTAAELRGPLRILDVTGFPIRRRWYAVHRRGKQLSVVARTFLEYLRAEAMASMALPNVMTGHQKRN